MPVVKGEGVVNGEIRIVPPPKWNHSEIIENLRDEIAPQIDRRLVKVRLSQFGLVIRLDPLTVREPDLAMFLAETIIEKDGYIHSPPQLAAEVLSPSNSRREPQEKLSDYASIGLPEVWVFSPEARTVEVLHLENGAYRRIGIFAEGILKPLHFPNVQIDIASIWPD